MSDQIKEKTQALIDGCKSSVHVTFNDHRANYQNVEKYLMEMYSEEKGYCEDDVWQEMIKKDSIVEVQFYPDTPIGFYVALHHDLESALDIALEILRKNREEQGLTEIVSEIQKERCPPGSVSGGDPVPDFDPRIPLERYRIADACPVGDRWLNGEKVEDARRMLRADLERLVPGKFRHLVKWFTEGPKPNDYDPLACTMYVGWRYIPEHEDKEAI